MSVMKRAIIKSRSVFMSFDLSFNGA